MAGRLAGTGADTAVGATRRVSVPTLAAGIALLPDGLGAGVPEGAELVLVEVPVLVGATVALDGVPACPTGFDSTEGLPGVLGDEGVDVRAAFETGFGSSFADGEPLLMSSEGFAFAWVADVGSVTSPNL